MLGGALGPVMKPTQADHDGDAQRPGPPRSAVSSSRRHRLRRGDARRQRSAILAASGASRTGCWSSSSVAMRMRPSAAHAASACASSSAVWKRRVGSREQARANHASNPLGTLGLIFDGAGIGEAQTLSTMSPSTSPSKGRRPVIAAKVHAPSDQRSVSGPGRAADGELLGCHEVRRADDRAFARRARPSATTRRRGGSSSNIFAMPKSTSFTT